MKKALPVLAVVLIFVLGLEALVEEYRETGTAMLLVMLALGNLVFVLYDLILRRLNARLAAQQRR